MYDPHDAFVYDSVDSLNDFHSKLVESYTSDSVQVFKAQYEGSEPLLVYVNPDGSIDYPDNVHNFQADSSIASMHAFVHSMITTQRKETVTEEPSQSFQVRF